MKKRIVLAYSGGLDTSVAVKWLAKEHDYEVVAMAVDVGQGGDFEVIRHRAIAAGAIAVEVIDARSQFANDFVLPTLFANGMYENKYPLVSSLSRPVIAHHLVETAKKYDAVAVAHGCTGKGNDQVRFEVGIRALNPKLEIVAPVRVWGFSRADSIDYAEANSIPIVATKDKPYSIDQNLWGRAIECGEMEDPWAPPPSDVYEMTVRTKSEPSEVVITFDKGKPTAIDHKPMDLVDIIDELNVTFGSYGFGRIDMVENRRVGIKSREVYEAPAALGLIMAHDALEDITLERDLAHEKAKLSHRFSELLYDGLWYSPLREGLSNFMEYTQQYVSGEVRLGLEPNRVFVSGRRSEYSLYDYELATYEKEDAFRHSDAEGFVRIWGLGVETWSRKQVNHD
ncbi:argininosuccinate synthase [Acidithrix ferrooxidans]|uniref:Argininosuccinate synthase n=1 Tax=Acidithrix ferrooxidans TaxID=1280514 RepID=A0A0D8HHL9_9ACTN|nr:argininosuccinate synthase [Acidithrix ferrooxidans]KJF16576.1 argininosuccinate synthase [Acidithrix ferrooxidans]